MSNRYTKFTSKKKRTFLKELERTGNITLAARLACVSRVWLYKQRQLDPKFAKKWEDAVNASIDLMLEEVRRRAYEGVEEPVFYQGRVCGHIRRYSDTLLMFKIKGERPEYATERREVTGRDGNPMQLEDLSDAKERLASRIAGIAARMDSEGVAGEPDPV